MGRLLLVARCTLSEYRAVAWEGEVTVVEIGPDRIRTPHASMMHVHGGGGTVRVRCASVCHWVVREVCVTGRP